MSDKNEKCGRSDHSLIQPMELPKPERDTPSVAERWRDTPQPQEPPVKKYSNQER
jgi:hypothetical protein